jgi:peptide/nickel transport system permease protein
MIRYCLRRAGSAVIVLVLASFGIFGILHLAPGNPAVVLAGADATPSVVAAITASLGLNKPLPVQYWAWLHGVLTGQLGRSYILGVPIGSLILHNLSNTAVLTVAASLIAVIVGFVLGVLGAITRNRFGAAVLTGINTIALAVPTYVSGIVLILVFSLAIPLLPPGGVAPLSAPGSLLRYLIMPAFCLALPVGAVFSRYLADALRQVLGEDFIRTARATGVSRWRIIWRHALPNALPQILAILGIQFGTMLGGAAIVEALFAWPGVGQLLVTSTQDRDYLVVQDLLLWGVLIFTVLQLLTDLGYAWLDPRVRLESR